MTFGPLRTDVKLKRKVKTIELLVKKNYEQTSFY